MKTTQEQIFLIVSSLILGMALVFFIPFLRYHHVIPPPVVIEVTPTETYEFIKANPENYLFLDVRSLGEYNDLHASSSISFPIADMSEDKKRNTIPMSREKRVYLICTSGRLAKVAYRFLEHHGYRNIYHIDGGIQAWVTDGMPAVSKNLF